MRWVTRINSSLLRANCYILFLWGIPMCLWLKQWVLCNFLWGSRRHLKKGYSESRESEAFMTSWHKFKFPFIQLVINFPLKFLLTKLYIAEHAKWCLHLSTMYNDQSKTFSQFPQAYDITGKENVQDLLLSDRECTKLICLLFSDKRNIFGLFWK